MFAYCRQMKNFFVALDGFHPSQSTLAYAIYLSAKAKASLTGLFLEPFFYHNYDFRRVLREPGDRDKALEIMEQKDQKLRSDVRSVLPSAGGTG